MDKQARNAFRRYFEFNNLRTLSTSAPSQLTVRSTPSYTLYSDPTRRYDNQITVHTGISLEILGSAISQYRTELAPQINFEQSEPSAEMAQYLAHLGYQQVFEHEFLSLSVKKQVSAQTHMRIERWGNEKADDFLALLNASGVVCSPQVWQAKKHLYCSDSFRCFVAFSEGQAIAWATSYVDGHSVTLANAYTLEERRGLGAQTQLLVARLNDAYQLGVTTAYTDVERGSISARNCEKLGFMRYQLNYVWERT
ncbi:GNAT family N-acetyltransferase [Vibrio sp. SCSIO 43136]|uniref:GNAT family N-acetyltransferase n=1 Tax=Vibrio sp. SCSIO 43136 TaxID=2819101 RepID=UPI002075762A|nr:GNAT family N-acetyltransferase [Vibrio sp. SCSIO 43136]USD66982.1 GNAT family N-acetyltransferase [Vibrio sp. SCSIO 43136]